MIKLVVNVCKKVPVPGVPYSSQNFSAGLEAEVADGTTDDGIRERLAGTYALLLASIDEQIAEANGQGGKGGTKDQSTSARKEQPRTDGRTATQAQVRAVRAIADCIGLDGELTRMLQKQYGAKRPEQLSVKECSDLIAELQREQRAGRRR